MITHCFFDSTNDVNRQKHGGLDIQEGTRTTFGDGTMDEMCFNFIQYYPYIPGFNQCFGMMGIGEVQKNTSTTDFEKNFSKAGDFDEDLCGPGRLKACRRAQGCYKHFTFGPDSGLCDAQVGSMATSLCAPFKGRCDICYPHSACGRRISDNHVDYVARTTVPRLCASGEASAEKANLKNSNYWSEMTSNNCGQHAGTVPPSGPAMAPASASGSQPASPSEPASEAAPSPEPASEPAATDQPAASVGAQREGSGGDDSTVVVVLAASCGGVLFIMIGAFLMYYYQSRKFSASKVKKGTTSESMESSDAASSSVHA